MCFIFCCWTIPRAKVNLGLWIMSMWHFSMCPMLTRVYHRVNLFAGSNVSSLTGSLCLSLRLENLRLGPPLVMFTAISRQTSTHLLFPPWSSSYILPLIIDSLIERRCVCVRACCCCCWTASTGTKEKIRDNTRWYPSAVPSRNWWIDLQQKNEVEDASVWHT